MSWACQGNSKYVREMCVSGMGMCVMRWVGPRELSFGWSFRCLNGVSAPLICWSHQKLWMWHEIGECVRGWLDVSGDG